ncbi:DUF2442 domain-containing protein [Ewingella americana]|jgi:hypothetical protein|uniref:DUF2442 domain-containing protein n=1 Tax=Ewingella americana TaxID=41202 RepID=A0A502G4U4_9GAMM|nr:DUF2442 domain-containing protein [Ewingella americana]TPG57047.1 DUF2442 domain-containing protein [Ewingella americana]
MATLTQFEAALQRGKQTATDPSRPVSVEYRPQQHAFMIMHGNGVGYLINIDLIKELEHATAEQLNTAEVDGFSKALRVSACDVDIYLPGLLAKILFDASDLQKIVASINGAMRSALKASASRENGKKGGRPRKSAESS